MIAALAKESRVVKFLHSLVIAFLSSAPAFAGPVVEKDTFLTTLGVIDAETAQDQTLVTVRLDKKPSWTEPKALTDHGTFLQLDLPGTIVPEPGQFLDGAGPIVKKIGVFQLTPSDAGVRFFIDGDAARAKQATSVELLDKRILLTVDHTKMATTADDVIAATAAASPEEKSPPPSELLAKKPTLGKAVLGSAVDGMDLRGKLIQVAGFCGVMLVLLMLALAVRPYLRKKAQLRAIAAEASGGPITMRTLNSLQLAPRQKVSVLQVGDERILLGITGDAVTFLTTLGKQAATQPARAPQPSFAKMLAEDTGTLELKAKPQPQPQPRAALKPRPPAPTVEPTIDDEAEELLASPPPPAPAAPKKAGARVNIAVGDDGAKNLRKPARAEPAPEKAIDDVTKMIREKLKTLRTI